LSGTPKPATDFTESNSSLLVSNYLKVVLGTFSDSFFPTAKTQRRISALVFLFLDVSHNVCSNNNRWRSFRNVVYKAQDRGKEWILVAFLGYLTATMAFVVDTCQAFLFDIKYGFCSGQLPQLLGVQS
jgi:hypothetical protein